MDREGNHIDLLISLLVRFPQIGTVHYEPEQKALRLVFLLKKDHQDFHTFAQMFESHLALFHHLKQEDVQVASLKKTESGADLTVLEVIRDLASLSLAELNVITELVSDYYRDTVIQEGPGIAVEDELEQNVMIDSLLMSLAWRGLERLTGFRDDGRVLVFSIPLPEVKKS